MTDTTTNTDEQPSVEDMTHDALRSEWQDICEELRTPIADEDEDMRLHVRRTELWNEMKARTDADPPECPECGGERWSQSFGDPKVCMGCDLHLGARYEQLIEDIDAYWRTVKSTGAPA